MVFNACRCYVFVCRLARADVVLTTYNIVSKEVGVTEDMRSKQAQEMPVTDKQGASESGSEAMLLRVAWQRIILDEAHSIKNHKSLTAMSVCRLRAMYRWALTGNFRYPSPLSPTSPSIADSFADVSLGTPIQNELLDMYSLLRFLRCSPFDEFKVWKRQVDNKSGKNLASQTFLFTCCLFCQRNICSNV